MQRFKLVFSFSPLSFELPVTFFWTLGNFGNTFLISFPVRGYSLLGWFVEKRDKIIPLGNSFHRRSQLIANPHKKILKPIHFPHFLVMIIIVILIILIILTILTILTVLTIMFSRCDGSQSCSIEINSGEFGDPCPATPKYLEVFSWYFTPQPDNNCGPPQVHYGCVPRSSATTKRPLPAWFLQVRLHHREFYLCLNLCWYLYFYLYFPTWFLQVRSHHPYLQQQNPSMWFFLGRERPALGDSDPRPTRGF